ncbi:MAG: hypothetical protein VW274_07935, partial [Thalassolituus sp.]
MGLLLVRRRHLAVLLAALPVMAFSAKAVSFEAIEVSEERLYILGSLDYSRFAPVTEGGGIHITDRHDWGFGIGAGYDLLDELAIEFQY